LNESLVGFGICNGPYGNYINPVRECQHGAGHSLQNEPAPTLLGRLKLGGRQPFSYVRSCLQLPGFANQKFTLPAVRQGFNLLLDA
jgi:hypothetical protein